MKRAAKHYILTKTDIVPSINGRGNVTLLPFAQTRKGTDRGQYRVLNLIADSRNSGNRFDQTAFN